MSRRPHPHEPLLRASRLFEGCPSRTLRTLAEHAQVLRVAADGLLMLERHRGERFLLLVQGSVSVRRDGREIARLGPDDFLGELALFDGGDRSATVVAVEPVQLLAWDRETFWSELASMPTVAARIQQEAERRRAAADASSAREPQEPAEA